MEPLRRGGVSEVFRGQYDRELRPALGELVASSPGHVAVTGVIVLGQLGTDRSLESLLAHSDRRDEPRMYGVEITYTFY